MDCKEIGCECAVCLYHALGTGLWHSSVNEVINLLVLIPVKYVKSQRTHLGTLCTEL